MIKKKEPNYNEGPGVVIDNGTHTIKAGFAGDETPKSVAPLLQEPKNIFNINITKPMIQQIPISHGYVTNWDGMEKIWHRTFYEELRVAPEEQPVFLTERPLNPKSNREKTTQIMMETFSVPAMYLGIQEVVCLYASGRTTGLVLDSGFGITTSVPIYEGYALPETTNKVDFGGEYLSFFLKKLLSEKVSNLSQNEVDDMKIKNCFVSIDYENQKSTEKKYELPDGNSVTLQDEQYKCPELLFKPSLIGLDASGVHEMLFKSVNNQESKKEMLQSVLLAGGSTMFEGFDERVQKELLSLVSSDFKINVKSTPDRPFSAFVGASILSSLSTFQCMWLSKYEYEDSGPEIVHRKCF